MFLLLPCCQSDRLKSFSALIIASGVSRGRGLHSAAVGKNTRRWRPFRRDSHLVHSLVVKTVAFCFHAEVSYAGTKAQMACIGGSRSAQIKPSRWCCDLVGLTLCHSALSDEAEPLLCYEVEFGEEVFITFTLALGPLK